MLHAAAMLLGFFGLWLLTTQRYLSVPEMFLGFGAAALCVLLALRLGGAGAAFVRAPRAAYGVVLRFNAVIAGALSTIRAALAADVTLKPALVRIRTRGRGEERAAFADLLSAAPGMVVVETDAEGFLAHVLEEDGVDAGELGRLERAAGAQEAPR
jgi:multisubunit Na+/H+ antiporter MnhE subunit